MTTTTSTLRQIAPSQDNLRSGKTAPINVRRDRGAVRGTLAANALLIVNTLLKSSATLLLMPLMIQVLGAQQYGLWITISTVTMYLSLSESGLGQTVVNWIGRSYALSQHQEIGQIMATAHVLYWLVVFPVGLAAIACVILLPVERILLSPQDADFAPQLKICLVIATALALARIPMLVFPGLLSGVRRLPTRLWYEMGGVLAVVAATLIALYAGLGLIGITTLVNLTLLLATMAMCLPAAQNGNWARLRLANFRSELLWPLTKNSSSFFVISAATAIDRSVTTLLVARFISLAAAPPFFFLTSIFRVAGWSFASALSKGIQPYVVMWSATDDQQRLVSSLRVITKTTVFGSAIGTAAFIPFAEPLVNIWVGDKCFPGNVVLALIIGSFLIDAVFISSVNFLIAMNRQHRLAFLLSVKTMLSIGLSIFFGTLFSNPMVGIASGAFVSSVIIAMALPWLVLQSLPALRKNYFDHFLLRPLAYAASLPAACLYLITVESFPERIFLTIAFLLTGTLMAWQLLFNLDDRQIVRAGIRKVLTTNS